MNARLLLQHIRRQTKEERRFARAIPQLLTFANAALGLFAILYAVEGMVLKGAWCLILAVICDGIDGRVARALKVTSAIGGELDSLADGVSFCLAPVVLLYSQFAMSSRLGIASLVMYLCAGLYRLARFNVASSSAQHFSGVPTTLAAWIIACMIIIQQHHNVVWMATPHTISIFLLVLSLLMISKIRVPKPGLALDPRRTH